MWIDNTEDLFTLIGDDLGIEFPLEWTPSQRRRAQELVTAYNSAK